VCLGHEQVSHLHFLTLLSLYIATAFSTQHVASLTLNQRSSFQLHGIMPSGQYQTDDRNTREWTTCPQTVCEVIQSNNLLIASQIYQLHTTLSSHISKGCMVNWLLFVYTHHYSMSKCCYWEIQWFSDLYLPSWRPTDQDQETVLVTRVLAVYEPGLATPTHRDLIINTWTQRINYQSTAEYSAIETGI